MVTTISQRTYPKEKRQEVFEALVGLQDEGMSLTKSREVICKRFALTSTALMDIEREGITEEWPPLDEDV
jgi:hypothetical protein